MELRYVYQAASGEVLSRKSGRLVAKRVPQGEGHIFKLHATEGLEKSYCGKTVYDIDGSDAVVLKVVATELPVCEECASKWKKDPASPWAKWQKQVVQ